MLDIGGYPMILADTAGLRTHTTDIVEIEGINRALAYYEKADLILLVIDSVKYDEFKNINPDMNLNQYIQCYIKELGLRNFFNNDKTYKRHCIVIMNKTDLRNIPTTEDVFSISCKTEFGFKELLSSIEVKLQEL